MKSFWKMPCFYCAVIGSVVTGLQMYPSLLPQGRWLDASHVLMGVIVLIAAWSRGMGTQATDDNKTPGGGTKILFALLLSSMWWGFALAGCATLKTVALDCGLPALAGSLGNAVEGLLADLSAWKPPAADEWKMRGIFLAEKYGMDVVTCAAGHLLNDAMAAGKLADNAWTSVPRPCHQVPAEYVPFLKFLVGQRK